MAVTYKDISQLTQKSSVAGTEKLPVSDTQYITPSQITAGCVHTTGSETVAGTKTFSNDVEIDDIISTENGDSYPSGFGWIQDYNGGSLQSALDRKQKAITVSSSPPTSSDGANGDIWIVI